MHLRFYLKCEHRNKYQSVFFLHLNGRNMAEKQLRFVMCRPVEVQDDAGAVLWPGSCEVGIAEQRAVSGFVQHIVI